MENMNFYKQIFCEFLLESGALKVGNNPEREDGNFQLKSGRISPFFMNLGDLNDGEKLRVLGTAYAEAIHEHFGTDFNTIFGPAYKGIPLAVTTAVQFQGKFNHPVQFCSNRKEIKDHGDSGILLGHKPKDGEKVIIVEDVTTSGKSIEETMPILKAQGNIEIVGLVVSFNRLEYGQDKSKTALEEISEKYGIKAHAIISMQDVVEVMSSHRLLTDRTKQSIIDYYAQYGPTSINTANWRW